ncbi:Alpha/Beta hydrolase protein [Dichotomocladium elegans]|nr:Alpha/Beta hydrolase protein [Dichotomocladium elegans]
MVHLEATQTYVIPVSPYTAGDNVQRLAVEQYAYPAPSGTASRSIAFLWSHANGFHKEVLHPLMHRLLVQLQSLPRFHATNVTFYAFDARNHGDSALLNAGHVHQPGYTWFDHAMDTHQVISELKLKENYDTLIGCGHSFGASAMILAEFFHPKTFDGLCIMEAVISKDFLPFTLRMQFPAIALTLKRRDTWPNREACLRSLEGRPFWKDLHPEALQNYVKYGLYDAPDGNVKLKCPKEEEHLVYCASQYSQTTAYNSLKSITIPVHMVHADRSTFTDPSTAPAIKALSPFITSSMVSGSHVVVCEKPDLLVPEILYLIKRVLAEGVKL